MVRASSASGHGGARIREHTTAGFAAVTLSSPDGRLAATFLPSLNMLGSSLVHDGDEILHLRNGIESYAAHGKTCGIPFLHPWANRLEGEHYEVAGRRVELSARGRHPSRDANGLPNHGLLGGRTSWDVKSATTEEGRATLEARLSFTSEELLANFPFPHELTMTASVGNDDLAVRVQLQPTSAQAVPVSFGFHPYLRLPGLARGDWEIAFPVRERLLLDERSIPTGASERVAFDLERLGTKSFDDAFTDIRAPRVFVMSGGGRRVEVEFGESYPYAQIYAPSGSDFVCIEPMTAPTNALVRGGIELRLVEPPGTFTAEFRIRAIGSTR